MSEQEPKAEEAMADFVRCLSVAPDLDQMLKGLDEPAVVAVLLIVEARLGTATEQPRDLAICQSLGHRWNNLRAGRILRHGCEAMLPRRGGARVQERRHAQDGATHHAGLRPGGS